MIKLRFWPWGKHGARGVQRGAVHPQINPVHPQINPVHPQINPFLTPLLPIFGHLWLFCTPKIFPLASCLPWGYAPWNILRESNENWSWAVNKKPAIAQQTLAHASVALVRALFVNLSQFYVCTRKCKYIQVLEQKFTQFFKVRLLSIHVL